MSDIDREGECRRWMERAKRAMRQVDTELSSVLYDADGMFRVVCPDLQDYGLLNRALQNLRKEASANTELTCPKLGENKP